MPANERIWSYRQGLEMLGVPYDKKAKEVFDDLIADGHSEKSICFAIFKTYDKLSRFVGDNRFWSVFKNEVLKWSWPKGDKRWNEYWKRKYYQKVIKEKEEKMRREQENINNWRVQVQKDKGKYPGFIYFIQGEHGGLIKIGYATDVSKRLASLQTGHPDNLKVLTFFPGNMAMEQLIHKDLKDFLLRGEWYKPDPVVLKKMKLYEARAIELSKQKGFNYKTCV